MTGVTTGCILRTLFFSDVSQLQKDIYYRIPLIYGAYSGKLTETERKMMASQGLSRGKNGEFCLMSIEV